MPLGQVWHLMMGLIHHRSRIITQILLGIVVGVHRLVAVDITLIRGRNWHLMMGLIHKSAKVRTLLVEGIILIRDTGRSLTMLSGRCRN
jgi:hypothetical protein